MTKRIQVGGRWRSPQQQRPRYNPMSRWKSLLAYLRMKDKLPQGKEQP